MALKHDAFEATWICFFSRAPLSIKSNPKQDTTQSSIDGKPASAPQVGLWFNFKAVWWKQTMQLRTAVHPRRAISERICSRTYRLRNKM